MSIQRTRPIDPLQRIVTSFKHFERKLDQLQDDVKVHGRTLSDLRDMVTTLSGGTILSASGRSEDKRVKKTTSIQYEDKAYVKNKRKSVMKPLPTKLKKGLQTQKLSNTSPQIAPFQVRVNKLESNGKGLGAKHGQRHRKAEAPRKATATIRTRKVSEKKRDKRAK